VVFLLIFIEILVPCFELKFHMYLISSFLKTHYLMHFCFPKNFFQLNFQFLYFEEEKHRNKYFEFNIMNKHFWYH